MLTDKKILLMGDQSLDRYHWCSVRDFNPEGPTPILDIVTCDNRPGMAANVAGNLAAFRPMKLDCVLGSEISVKNRYMDQRSRRCLIRIDQDTMSRAVSVPQDLDQYDAVVISDYSKGSVTLELILDVRNRYAGPMFIDTKIRDLCRLQGCVIKINEREWNHRISDHPEVIVTKGANGATYHGRDYPASRTDAHDVCGAGDTFLAALVAGYLQWHDMPRSIDLALAASALAVKHVGTYSLSTQDVESICAS